MLSATLGGLIKDHRIRKRLSQLEVSLRIGWKDTTRLSKIEQGRVGTPTRATIDKIINALELEGPEKGEFLLAGGYLPTEEEIEHIRNITKETLDNWPYPATIIDFSWRSISENKHTAELFHFSKDMQMRLKKDHLRVLEVLFDKDLMQNQVLKGQNLEDWHKYLYHVTAHFKYEQKNRTKEKWYINFVKIMLKNELFRQIWTSIKLEEMPKVIVGKFAIARILDSKSMKNILSFYLFMVPVLEDPRFEEGMFVPMDLETYKYFSR